MINGSIPEQDFRAAIEAASLPPPEQIIADGKLHRFPTSDKRGDDAGWYVLHVDNIPAGAFGCFRGGFEQKWCAGIGRAFTAAEKSQFRERMEAARRKREADQAQRHAAAAKRAQAIWKAAVDAPPDHPYLKRKGVQAHGVKLYRGEEARFSQCLVVPVGSADKRLTSLQFIPPEKGEKKNFLFGGEVNGGYFPIGSPNGVICIAEGLATSASIHEATGHAVAVAFDAGNLERVAEVMRRKYAELGFIVCADDDSPKGHTVGLDSATRAARAVGGKLAIPDFGDDRPDDATDFNDLHLARGLAAVRECIERAPEVEKKETGTGLRYRRMCDVAPQPIHWLWPGRIARGKVTIIAGNPGLGKSQVTVNLASIVTTGGEWPLNGGQCEVGNVVMFSAEDDPADTIRPRLDAVAADSGRVVFVDAVQKEPRGVRSELRSFDLTRDLPKLSATLSKIGDVALVIVDPVTAYLGATDSHKNAEVRAVLAPLAELAAEHGAAVVCVSHLNKNSGQEALLRIMGSLGFVAAARAAFAVCKDKEDPDRCLFLPLKNNLSAGGDGLAFRVEELTLPGGIQTSRVCWEAEPVTVMADEALAGEEQSDRRSARAAAKEFLLELLALGQVSAQQVRKEAEEAGHSWGTVNRAKADLGIKPIRGGFGDAGKWTWELPKVRKKPKDAQPPEVHTYGKSEHLWGESREQDELFAAQERAAIMEHDGGVAREEADAAAFHGRESGH